MLRVGPRARIRYVVDPFLYDIIFIPIAFSRDVTTSADLGWSSILVGIKKAMRHSCDILPHGESDCKKRKTKTRQATGNKGRTDDDVSDASSSLSVVVHALFHHHLSHFRKQRQLAFLRFSPSL
jgi:hypothetical protein